MMLQWRIYSKCKAVLSAALFIGLCLGLTACGSKKTNDVASYNDPLHYSGADEVVLPPDLPDDDGAPLTDLEKKILCTPSELGQPVSTEDWQDVVLHFKYFTRKKRESFQRFLDRSELWLPYVQQTFRENKVPEEIAFLAFVESGFNPNAVSRVGATGVWQFMPYTGAKYGLTQNAWVDERRDTYKATQAAADYLNKLYGDFGNWYLAMAAYNAGEGKISRAINCVGSDTFFDLSRKNHMLEGKTQLKEETRQYVPRFIAVSKIMKNLKELGFREPNPKGALDLEPLELKSGTDLVGLSRNLGMSWDEFVSLNPSFKRQSSHPRDTTVAYVPPFKKEVALAFLDRQESRALAGWNDYKVKKGENLASLSKKFKVPASILRKVNQGNLSSIKAGDVVMVPANKEALRNVADAMPAEAQPIASTGKAGKNSKAGVIAEASDSGFFHTVAPGETLFSLARSWNSTPDAVRKLNKMGPDAMLKSGQRLAIPGGASGGSTQLAAVKSEKTAKPAPNLIAAVGKPQNALKPGKQNFADLEKSAKADKSVKEKKVTRVADAATPAKNAKSGSRYVVQPGDTLYSLARKNSTSVDAIIKANGFDSSGKLKVGASIKMP